MKVVVDFGDACRTASQILLVNERRYKGLDIDQEARRDVLIGQIKVHTGMVRNARALTSR